MTHLTCFMLKLWCTLFSGLPLDCVLFETKTALDTVPSDIWDYCLAQQAFIKFLLETEMH